MIRRQRSCVKHEDGDVVVVGGVAINVFCCRCSSFAFITISLLQLARRRCRLQYGTVHYVHERSTVLPTGQLPTNGYYRPPYSTVLHVLATVWCCREYSATVPHNARYTRIRLNPSARDRARAQPQAFDVLTPPDLQVRPHQATTWSRIHYPSRVSIFCTYTIVLGYTSSYLHHLQLVFIFVAVWSRSLEVTRGTVSIFAVFARSRFEPRRVKPSLSLITTRIFELALLTAC